MLAGGGASLKLGVVRAARSVASNARSAAVDGAFAAVPGRWPVVRGQRPGRVVVAAGRSPEGNVRSGQSYPGPVAATRVRGE
jgi:hypothetical protein